MTRKEHGLPPQPFNFFKNIYDHVISKNLGMVTLASLGQENVAGAIYFHFGEKALYKYGASDKKIQQLRPNNLVMWEAIKWYSQNGYKSLCFGRTEPENQGLIQFKSGWGTTEQQINYYRYDFKKEAFVTGTSKVTGFHNKIFRRMPAPLLRGIGSALYKHVG
jgi:lipid II:glycine glycyltransferase (peptidoglycan interpeptide bridge formation enzyme)